jgi:chromosome segregation ATPase
MTKLRKDVDIASKDQKALDECVANRAQLVKDKTAAVKLKDEADKRIIGLETKLTAAKAEKYELQREVRQMEEDRVASTEKYDTHLEWFMDAEAAYTANVAGLKTELKHLQTTTDQSIQKLKDEIVELKIENEVLGKG